MRIKSLVLITMLATLTAGPARATEDNVPGVARVIQTNGAAQKGAVSTVTVEILSRPGAVVDGVRLVAAKGWSEATLVERNPSDFPLDPAKAPEEYERRVFELSARAKNPSAKWELEFYVDDHLVVETLDLTADSHVSELVPASETITALDDASKFVRPAPAGLSPDERERPSLSKTTRDIRVKGRIQYRRMPDGVVMGADGVTVKIHDEEGTFVTNLFTTTTDVNGNFDVTFPWDDSDWIDPQPDILIEVELANAYAQVRSTDVTSENYKIRQHYFPDFTGTFIDIGDMMPADPIMHGALNILTVITRTWRWYDGRGYTMPQTTFRSPNDSAFHRPFDGVIYLSSAWDEGTMIHEYGHRWVSVFAQQNASEYCNGICNLDMPDCGHCMWCQESTSVAWSEGYPDFLGDVIPRRFAGIYAIGSANAYDIERLGLCADPPASGGYDDPDQTEGFVAAMLVDLVDNNDENDPMDPAWADQSEIPVEDILFAADTVGAHHGPEFIQALYTTIKASGSYTPQDIADFWETGMNNGYDLDLTAPANPGSYGSSTHTPGVSSRANWPSFWWTTPSDDASGIAGYALSISPFPSEPANVIDIGPENGYQTTAPLSPGSYYLNLKTADRSGKWASGFISIGPIIILSPEPIDFEPTVPEFWAGELVPRHDWSGSSGSVFAPTELNGGGNTYLNYAYRNSSASSVIAPAWTVSVRLEDFSLRDTAYPSGLSASGQLYTYNSTTPVTVQGGRHTLSLVLDSDEDVGESDDLNNRYGKQWIWSPEALPALGSVNSEPIVRGRTRGWTDIAVGPTWFNCSGFRMQTGAGSGWWKAVTVTSVREDIDYDARLHAPSTGPTDGFAANLAWSARPGGKLDALFTNRNNVGAVEYDIGVINNHPPGTGVILKTGFFESTLIPYDSDITLSFAEDEHLALREINVSTEQLGSFSALVSIDPTEGPVTAMWLDSSTTVADMLDFAALATTDATGQANLSIDVTTPGWYCLVIYREPFREATLGKQAGPISIGVRTGATPPNAITYNAAGWAAPLVPRPTNDGTPGSVPAPTTLTGDAASTYLNLAFINDSIAPFVAINSNVRLDGATALSLTLTNLAGGNPVLYNHPVPTTVRGGRHTLALKLDPNRVVDELREDDNVYGAQWVFEPTTLAPDISVTRSAPPEPTAGHDDITINVSFDPNQNEGAGFEVTPEIFPNCDGLRAPLITPSGQDKYWLAVAVMPGEKSNTDLRLHELSSDASSGFDTALTGSFWPDGQSDFALVNFRLENPRALDVGLLKSGPGTESYTVHTASSTFLGTNPVGSHGAFTIGADRILDLYELDLSEGIWNIKAENLSADVDLGVSIYPPSLGAEQNAFMGKINALPAGIQWHAGPGEDEYLIVEVGQGGAGYYCLAVWKPAAFELAKSADYNLVLSTGATAAPDIPGARTASLEVSPNPFNPRTVVSFRLQSEEDVNVAVYNLRGALVRELVKGPFAPGEHRISFNGLDDNGRQLATGTYLVQLRTSSGLLETEKISLLK